MAGEDRSDRHRAQVPRALAHARQALRGRRAGCPCCAVSLVRSRAAEWKLNPERIGVLGFSAGGETAGLAVPFTDRQYTAIDAVDEVSCRPDFAVLVYPAYLVTKEGQLASHFTVTKNTPPMFLGTPTTIRSRR